MPDALVTGAVVIEDLAAGGFDERALFHLMNMAREDTAYVLMTGARLRRPRLAVALRRISTRGCGRFP